MNKKNTYAFSDCLVNFIYDVYLDCHNKFKRGCHAEFSSASIFLKKVDPETSSG